MRTTEQQRTFILSCMEFKTLQNRYLTEKSRRINNNAFYCVINSNGMRFCKTNFKSTLAITDRPIRTVLARKRTNYYKEKRGKHGKHTTVPPQVKAAIRSPIEKISTIESLFCRSQTKRHSIKGNKTIKNLHRDYVMYSRIFNEEYHFSFFKPKTSVNHAKLRKTQISKKTTRRI